MKIEKIAQSGGIIGNLCETNATNNIYEKKASTIEEMECYDMVDPFEINETTTDNDINSKNDNQNFVATPLLPHIMEFITLI